jgi:hypothetical protein
VAATKQAIAAAERNQDFISFLPVKRVSFGARGFGSTIIGPNLICADYSVPRVGLNGP